MPKFDRQEKKGVEGFGTDTKDESRRSSQNHFMICRLKRVSLALAASYLLVHKHSKTETNKNGRISRRKNRPNHTKNRTASRKQAVEFLKIEGWKTILSFWALVVF